MLKVFFISLIFLFSETAFSQYLPGEVQKVNTDSSWYSKLDVYQQQGLEEWIVNYNKGVDYYNSKDFESANFYFEKVLRRSPKELFSKTFWTGATKNNLTVQLNESIYFFRYIGYLNLAQLPRRDLEKAFNKVKSHCPPILVRIAISKTEEYNATRRNGGKIDYTLGHSPKDPLTRAIHRAEEKRK